MDLLYKNEHQECFNYDKRAKPQVEVANFAKGKKGNLTFFESEIVFFMEGRIKFVFNDFPGYEGQKGQFLFLPSGGKYSYQVISNTMVLIFRLSGQIRLCDMFNIEELYCAAEEVGEFQPRTQSRFSVLDINPRMWHFLDGMKDYLSDGMRCRSFFDLKLKELFFILRMYYTKEELYGFFFLILSEDSAFSEYIRLRWQCFHTIQELADSMNLSHKQFCAKFVSVFGKHPQKWISEAKARIIHNEIISTTKQFKQIAAENGFVHETIFTRFCKRELGLTPTQIREKKNGKGDKS
ncbi:helix-turn-helix domain-containing protein [Bacteroidales bacterium OttesenSCG-928-J19]|nr:helix-turn-helix domain-containing protein [Bacteroidales bacterium OttesenSCG-928-J19]